MTNKHRAALLREVEAYISQYVILPDDLLLLVSLWAIATHCFDLFDSFPYLIFTSPEKRCGKTRATELLEFLVREPQSTVGISPAALFRIIQEKTPTLVVDEAETLTNGSETAQNLISILNAGYRMGKAVMRCEPPAMKVTSFQVYCPKVLCGINDLPDTIMDRAVVVRMRRKNGANLKKFRFSEAGKEAAPIKERIDVLLGPDSNLTSRLDIQEHWRHMSDDDVLGQWVDSDRDIENLMPLAALCFYLDQDRWPDFRESCLALNSTRKVEDSSLGARLAQDVGELIGALPDDQLYISNTDLVNALGQIEDAPWADTSKFNANRLARLLRVYGVLPTQVRQLAKKIRGYHIPSLRTALSPYFTRDAGHSIENKEDTAKTSGTPVPVENEPNPFILRAVSRVPVEKGGKGLREPGDEEATA
jgi:hypothetical protein